MIRGPIVKAGIIAAAWLIAATLAFAQGVTPEPSHGDPRIRVVAWSENQIVRLRGHLGYQMLVEFDPDERIENVAIGDSLGWQVTPNRAATLLFVKPIARGAATNMTVVTNLRRYAFELSTREATGPADPNIIYTVRFSYPPPPARAGETGDPAPPAPAPTNVADLNLAYSTRGGRGMAPVRVFDDGAATYFQFAEGADAAAVFVIGADGKEELVNAQWRGPYMVVDQIAQAFILRIGRANVRVKNDGWRAASAPVLSAPPTRKQ
jgi:type IV secretion system protein VirB9